MTLRIGTIKEAIERKLILPVQFINLATYPLRKLFGAEDLKLYYTKWGSALMPLRWGRDNDEIECKIGGPSITRLSHKQDLEAVENNPHLTEACTQDFAKRWGNFDISDKKGLEYLKQYSYNLMFYDLKVTRPIEFSDCRDEVSNDNNQYHKQGVGTMGEGGLTHPHELLH
jgi:hypothetical protein